jgi:ferredoxin
MKVQADMTRCIGSGMCTTLAPDLFELDEKGALHVTVLHVPQGLEGAAREAAACCPVAAIGLVEG